MFDRKLKATGVAIGFAALMFASGAGAVDIGGWKMGGDGPDGIAGNDDDVPESIGSYSARVMSAQAFQGQARTINAKILVNTAAAKDEAGAIFLKFPRAVRYDFGLTLRLAGAEFADQQVTATALTFAAGAYTLSSETCSAFPRDGSRVRLRSCGNPADDATPEAIVGMIITQLNITTASGLGTAGHSISLTATLHDDEENEVIHTSDAAAIYRSVNSATATIAAARAPVAVDPESEPPFARLVGGEGVGSAVATIGTLGSVTLVKNDMAHEVLDNAAEPTVVMASAIVEGAAVAVSHPAFADDAFYGVSLTLPGTPADPDATPAVPAGDPEVVVVKGSSTDEDEAVVEDGVAEFEVPVAKFAVPVRPPAQPMSIPIKIHFDGKNRISSWGAGTASAAFMDAESPGAQTYGLPPGAEGALARVSRGGLNVHLNGVRNSYGNGSDLYQSVVRITNNGVVPGTIDVTVYDSADGEMLGEFTSPVIYPGTMIQWTAAQVEAVLGHTPDGIVLYNIVLDGAITGYVQHLNWNSVDNLFSDLSGFRRGELQGQP